MNKSEWLHFCVRISLAVTHREVKAGMVNSPDVDTMNVNKVLSFHRTLNDINIEDVLASM